MKIKAIHRSSIVCKNGKSPLMLRFIHERTSKRLSLGISVEPHDWDKDAEMITADCPDRAALQSRIDSTLETYRKIFKSEINSYGRQIRDKESAVRIHKIEKTMQMPERSRLIAEVMENEMQVCVKTRCRNWNKTFLNVRISMR